MDDHRGMRHDTDICDCKQSWSSIRQLCAGAVRPAGLSEVPHFRHGDEAAYIRRLFALFSKSRENTSEKGGFIRKSLCYFKALYNKIDLVRGGVDGWCELDFERRKGMNEIGCRFVV